MGRAKDITGQKFGRLTAIRFDHKHKTPSGQIKYYWLCKCECTQEITVSKDHLVSGHTVSCGCYNRDKAKNSHTTHGKRFTRLYNVWVDIKQRCLNPKNNSYKYYGERGITICETWKNDFITFCNWAYENGYDETAPRGLCTIDRIDVNGNYCPENCRWVDSIVQAQNKRHYNRLTRGTV